MTMQDHRQTTDMAEKSPSLDYRAGAAADGEVGGRAASDEKYRKLIFFMPTALWQVDSRATGEVFGRLKADGLTDIAAYLDQHPELVEIARDTVLVTEVNREAVSLFRGQRPADLIRPVRYLFAGTPDRRAASPMVMLMLRLLAASAAAAARCSPRSPRRMPSPRRPASG